MATIFDVAKYILRKKGKLSTIKLQKLCYYAQAWSLVWDDCPLFEEDFEAWANGPMCKELFEVTKGQFWATEQDYEGDTECLNDNQKDTINVVLDYYGGKSSYWLSELSRKEAPWKEAREGINNGECSSNIITKDSIALYYSSLSE